MTVIPKRDSRFPANAVPGTRTFVGRAQYITDGAFWFKITAPFCRA